jgi:hypothetical protein
MYTENPLFSYPNLFIHLVFRNIIKTTFGNNLFSGKEKKERKKETPTKGWTEGSFFPQRKDIDHPIPQQTHTLVIAVSVAWKNNVKFCT